MSCRSCDLTLWTHGNGSSICRPRAERVAKSSITAAVKSGRAMKAATTKMSASSAATEVGAAAESAASKSASAATGPCRMA